ncbi:Plasmodium exported protein, unknown function [Plasmodium gonderi]|uniref:Uncharacterized protein n=1 Tax=Plasmodium gonderi TaxID=77519 RepID=A0A1Y1JE68_PLAGO|nr:Plasmodium exported protein, unknown function [Plasmodium gonderi]GAW80796.1 Plasmodium exported protein, unknown function [Plasmodium gonderi]
MNSNFILYDIFGSKSSINSYDIKNKSSCKPSKGRSRTTGSFYKLLVSCALVFLCILPLCKKQDNAFFKGELNSNARILAMRRTESNPCPNNTVDVSEEREFQLIIEAWASFEERVKKQWIYLEYQEIAAWSELLLGTWLTASVLMNNNTSDATQLFQSWLDMSQKLSRERISKNEEDDKILEKLLNKLKYKALNQLIKNWDTDIERMWVSIMKMKLEKNLEWCNFVREQCNSWINYNFY